MDEGHQSRKNRLALLSHNKGGIGVGVVTLEKHTYVYILVVVRFDCKKNCQFDAVTKKVSNFEDVWKGEAAVAYKSLEESLKKNDPLVRKSYQRNLEPGSSANLNQDTAVEGSHVTVPARVDDVHKMVKDQKEVQLVTEVAQNETNTRTQVKRRLMRKN